MRGPRLGWVSLGGIKGGVGGTYGCLCRRRALLRGECGIGRGVVGRAWQVVVCTGLAHKGNAIEVTASGYALFEGINATLCCWLVRSYVVQSILRFGLGLGKVMVA